MENKKISILGCGWYGLALAKKLLTVGYEVKGSTTSEEKIVLLETAGIAPYLVIIDCEETQYDEKFFDCDILFIAIPPKSRSPQVAEYTVKVKLIADLADKFNVKQLILISSSGIYQDGNFKVNETIVPHPTTAAGQALLMAENSIQTNSKFTATIIRFSGLIGPGRDLSKYFAGRINIPNGLAPINLIHLSDCLGLSLWIIEQKAFGKIYHGVSPSHPTKLEFYTKACVAAGLEPPIFLKELIDWKLIESKNVPEVLAYEYVYKVWDNYFDELAKVPTK